MQEGVCTDYLIFKYIGYFSRQLRHNDISNVYQHFSLHSRKSAAIAVNRQVTCKSVHNTTTSVSHRVYL